jgi:hypothetical protein
MPSKRQRVLTQELDWPAARSCGSEQEEQEADAINEADVEAVLTKAYAEVERMCRPSKHKQEDPRPRCSCPLRVGAMEAVDQPGRGRGWVATADIPAGRTVLCESPLAYSMDWQADALESEALNVDTASLILALADQLRGKSGPQLLKQLQTLSPLPGEPGKDWTCDDPELATQVEQSLKRVPKLSPAERKRLKRVVRANSLGIYTNSEQLCYPDQFVKLGGVALYLNSSLFNHNCHPNTTRFNVGAIAVFRTNRLVRKGEELCISYIESDVLCEPASLRNLELGGRDFKVRDPGQDSEDEDDEEDDADEMEEPEEPELYRKVDEEAQEALLELDPPARLENINALLEDMETRESFLRADRKELSLLQAVACTQLGYYSAALGHWEDCIAFAAVHCPPHDECLVCYSVHAAIAARLAEQHESAAAHMQTAAKTHNIAFGGGAAFLRMRYAKEIEIFGKGNDQQLWQYVD